MKSIAAVKFVLLVTLTSFVCSEDLTYNEFILKGFHRYNPIAEKDAGVKPMNSALPIITNALAKFLYTGAGSKEGSVEFSSLGDSKDAHCGGQMGIEWFEKTYCLQKIVFNSDEHFVPPEAEKEFQSASKSESKTLSSIKSTIMLPVDMTKFLKKLFIPSSARGLLPTKTAAMELYLRDTQDSHDIKIKVPLFQESSKSADQAKYADTTIRCEPIPLEELKKVQTGETLVEFEIGWISDLFHKTLTEVSGDTYVTYPVVMPKETMGKLLSLVNEVNPKTLPVGPLPLGTEEEAISVAAEV